MAEAYNDEEFYKDDGESLDIQSLIEHVIKRLWIIAIVGVLCAFVGFIYSAYFQTEMYAASTTVYVLDRESDSRSNNALTGALSAGLQLTGDYAQIIKSNTVCAMVIEKLGIDLTPSALASMVTVATTSDETRVLRITVSSPNPAFSQSAANTLREVASEYLIRVMDLPNINLIDEAELPTEPYSPNVKKNVLIFLLAGVLLSGAVVVAQFMLDDTIKTEDDVRRRLELSVLGSVPNVTADGKPQQKKSVLDRYVQRIRLGAERRANHRR